MRKIAFLLFTTCLALSVASAQNLLQNGDFNGNNTADWTTWTYGGGWIGTTTTPTDLYDGSPCIYMGGNANAGAGLYQIVFGVPNVPYTVSCVSKVDAWWWPAAEMRLFFLDASGNTISSAITNCAAGITAYDTGLPWAAYTNTAVSPPGTAQVKVEFACPTGTGTILFDDAVLTAPIVYPTISNLYPDGSLLMQATNAFSFTAASTATPIDASGIQVIVNGIDVSSNLVITGSSMSKNVSYPGIVSNQTYTASIVVNDENGVKVTKSISFDTFSASYYTFEAEDWDYSSNGVGGLFIDNPQIDAYYNLPGIPGTDYNETSTGTNTATWAYRAWTDANTPVPQTEITSDMKRAQYANTNDYDIGWFDAGEWLNYTRTYPVGLYNVYARMSSPGASTLNLSQVTSGQGTAAQTTVSLGNFVLQNGLGWGTYSWVPLTDTTGNLVKLNLGGVATLRATAGGNANFNFIMLVPANTNAPTITGMYPDGSTLFQATNKLSFTVNSTVGVNPSGVSITLGVTNVDLHFSTNLTSTNGLVIGGTPSTLTVSYPGLIPNAKYSAVITVSDTANNKVTVSPSFDTYAPVFTWEAEDYDYGGGLFIPNPGVDAYGNLSGVEGTDFHDINGLGPESYRPDKMSTGLAFDIPRTQYLSPPTNDYALGYFTVGEWVNYTRTFPAGTYNVYARLSAGGGTSVQSLSIVNNGAGTSNLLGNFTGSTAGWSSYDYVPLRDQFGNLANVTLNGQTTLNVTRVSGGDANENFFMLLPADTVLPRISLVTPLGWVQSTNTMQFVVTSTAGVATSNIIVTLNGISASAVLSFSGSANNWLVNCGLAPSTVYTAVISVTDNNGLTASTTVKFDTFSLGCYIWEAEDYDYGSGQFIPDAQVNAYAFKPGTPGVDFTNAATGGVDNYRGDGSFTEVCGDFPRPQFTGTYEDLDLSYTAAGDWWNYTRTYPAGTYNVYVRAAYNNASTVTMGLQKVTSGWGTTTQSTSSLGTFTIPNTGGWQTYTWIPLKDSTGALANITFSGSTNTLRLTGGGPNLNFLLLAPARVLNGSMTWPNMNFNFGTQPGFNYTVLSTPNLNSGSWTPVNSVSGDGTTHAMGTPANGPVQFYRLQIH